MKKKSKREIGDKFENKVRKSINSGTLWFDKGDLKTENFIIECKFTEGKSYRITTKILEKLWNDAFESNKLPFLAIGIKDGNNLWLLDVQIKKEVK